MSDLFPYSTIITFPVQRISDSETMQLIMTFEHATGSNRTWNAVDYNLKVERYGNLLIDYDLDDPVMVPSKISQTIADPGNVIEEMLFGTSTLAQATDKRFLIELKVNASTVFIGCILEDSIVFNENTKRLTYTSSPNIDIINKTNLYNRDGEALNPFEKTEGGAVAQGIVGILEDVYGLVDDTISFPTSLIIDHLWKFRGIRSDYDGNVLEDIELSELEVTTNNFYFDNTFDLKTCGDLLRKLAIDWGAFTGMLSNGKAFFKKLFYYDPANVQTVNVKSHIKAYKYELLDYVRVVNYYALSTVYEKPNSDAYTEAEGRYLERKLLASQTYYADDPPTWAGYLFANCSRPDTFAFLFADTVTTMPAIGDTYSHNSSVYEVVGTRDYDLSWATGCITGLRISGTNDPETHGDLTRLTGSGDATIAFTASQDLETESPYRIIGSKDNDLLSGEWQLNHADLVAEFWWHWRGNINYCRVDKFVLKGVTYDFLKSFNYGGKKYQPISMDYHFSQGITICEAIYLGEL